MSRSNEILQITERVSIPVKELTFTTSRSSGPGGQHVNTTDTRVTVRFNVDRTQSLTQLQKVAVRGKLRRKIDSRGVLSVTSQKFRSQKSNRESALERFVELLRWALKPVTPRKETLPTLGSVRRRLESKKRLARKKQNRRRNNPLDDY
ncbi:alternative ribosome rescue aminoacyl-tRNA hydrolase ArfB [Pseudodesulfovibrio tunisiensis]|uniref:alternative ribosome rescue aminoacyl-tRNA hydrolase ArfB n=1 Tax=Pseudodesulfovibrio tunisiensis TaxID=463192 RepID=UPI001FB26A60|nr:alternative ribosome rescue aminoacyl-tRNA hydrolase ArfB [Pseudodesulfovibrio tunisiensis]